MVNGPSYKKWKLPLPVMATLYRLAGQVRRAPRCARSAPLSPPPPAVFWW